jgi:ABC-type glutathione transport system ATPase component
VKNCFPKSATPDMLRAENISKSYFPGKKREIRVLDHFSLALTKGEICGLIGGSGGGKSTAARIMCGLESADSGRIFFQNRDITNLRPGKKHPFAGKMQMIFQDPFSSMSPRMKIADILAEPLRIQKQRENTGKKVREILERVEMAADCLVKYPFELSGGERQRIAIARCLLLQPVFIIADEILSMLDTSRKSRILDLLYRLRKEENFSLLFITHDIALAACICDSIAVLHAGRIVEKGRTGQLLSAPQHRYTRSLMAAVPCRLFPVTDFPVCNFPLKYAIARRK